MSIDESGESIELRMCELLFWRVSPDQALGVLKDFLLWHLNSCAVLVDLVLGYNPEPKWYAHVGVYESLQRLAGSSRACDSKFCK